MARLITTQPPARLRVAAATPWRATLRRAFAGLTATTLAIFAALVFARSFSWALHKPLPQPLDEFVTEVAVGFLHIGLMTLPGLLTIVAVGNLGPRDGWRRIVALGGVALLSPGLGIFARLVVGAFTGYGIAHRVVPSYLLAVWPRYTLLALLLTLAFELYRRERATIDAARRSALQQETLAREFAAARLQALNAQIEPHFLFNTLAHLRRLIAVDDARGRTMLDSLTRYLDVALPELRGSHTALARDIELIAAYLQIQQIRMGRRLAWTVEVPADLGARRVPSMMLLTLVENAVKHGLQPAPAGGAIHIEAHIEARAEAPTLLLVVADTGVGFTPGDGSGSGTGLANLRARLAAQYGDAASLSLAINDFGGVTATIALPFDRTEPA